MEKNYVDALRSANDVQIRKLYYTYREAFYGFSRKYGLSPDDIADIYQDSFIAMRGHALTGKLYQVESSFKTYLFGVAKNHIFETLKGNSLKEPYEPNIISEEPSLEIEDLSYEKQHIFYLSFKEMGENCRELLTMSIYRGLTNTEITQIRGYENEAVTRSHKSRCIKKLKEIVQRNLSKWTDKSL